MLDVLGDDAIRCVDFEFRGVVRRIVACAIHEPLIPPFDIWRGIHNKVSLCIQVLVDSRLSCLRRNALLHRLERGLTT